MPRRKLIRPAIPAVLPPAGSLEECIMLGDQAAVYAKPAAQIRWIDRRAELLLAIEKKKMTEQENAGLKTKNAELENQLAARPPAPPVPAPDPQTDAKSVDPESKQRLAKLLKQLGAPRDEPTPVPEVYPPELKAAKDAKKLVEAEKKAAEDLEKKEANDKRIARIAELKTLRESIYKNMNTPGFNVMMASNSAFGRAPLEGLRSIEAELRQLEDTPVSKVPDQFTAIVNEQREDNRRTQKEYQAEYNFQRSGMQISPSNLGLFRDGE